MRSVLLVLLILVVLGALEGGYYVLRFVRERRIEALRRRLRSLGSGASELSLLRPGKLAASPAVDELLAYLPLARRLERLLEQTDLRVTVAQLLTASAGIASAVIGIGLLAGIGAAPLLVLGLAGGLVPTAFALVSRSRRSRKLSEQLPDALEMMARSLRAGHALTGAFQLLASELPEPINLEFGRAYEQQNLGLSLEQSVLQMAARAPGNRDLKIFAVSVVVQKETGGNLAEILEKISETIRARYRFNGKLAALTAEGRISGLVLGFLPVGMAGFLALANPKYMARLVVDDLGTAILIYAVASWALGLFWMNRMTKVEV